MRCLLAGPYRFRLRVAAMRALGLLLISAWPIMASVGRAETKFPYEVTIPAGGVELRSGPGPSFYATDRLPAGERMEVYREEKDGWLAVRPPSGCFSLVERRQLKAADEANVAVVAADDVLCCVGSRVDPVQAYVSQVRLRKGERVELLDKWDAEKESAAGSGETAWCRIWPPAGEFRWVHADDLKRSAPVATNVNPLEGATAGQKPTVAPRTSFDGDGWRTRPDTGLAGRTASEPAPPAAHVAADDALKESRPVSQSPSPEADGGWTATPQNSRSKDTKNAAVDKPQTPAASLIRVPADSEKVIGPAVRSVPIDLTQRSDPTKSWSSRTPPPLQPIDELELELSMMVAGDMRAWRLADLRQRVDANLVRYESTAERVQARQLLDRIAEFEQLQSRMTQAAPATPAASSNSPVTNAAPLETSPAPAADVKYDGSGWLVPVHSATGTAPPFALLDAQGDVLGYVSPTPGLNLQRYVRKQVGIFGQRGYVQSLNKPHVTAERVVDLDRHLR